MGWAGITFELGQIQFTEYDEDSEALKAQPDAGGMAPRLASEQVHHFLGVASRPNDPELGPNGKPLDGSGSLALIGKDGTDRFIIPLGDPRDLAKLPRLKKGERMLYGPAANFARCHADGSVTTFTTTDGTLNGKSVYAQVRPDGILWVAPWGKLSFDANGFHMLHSSGARMDAGAIGGLPSPLDQLGSYFKIAAASVQIEGAIVAIGTAAGASDAAARATPTVAALAAIAGALTAIQEAMVAMGPALVPGQPATLAATKIATAAVAVSSAVSVIGSAPTTIPSATTVT
jgi:hypothetical protein